MTVDIRDLGGQINLVSAPRLPWWIWELVQLTPTWVVSLDRQPVTLTAAWQALFLSMERQSGESWISPSHTAVRSIVREKGGRKKDAKEGRSPELYRRGTCRKHRFPAWQTVAAEFLSAPGTRVICSVIFIIYLFWTSYAALLPSSGSPRQQAVKFLTAGNLTTLCYALSWIFLSLKPG